MLSQALRWSIAVFYGWILNSFPFIQIKVPVFMKMLLRSLQIKSCWSGKVAKDEKVCYKTTCLSNELNYVVFFSVVCQIFYQNIKQFEAFQNLLEKPENRLKGLDLMPSICIISMCHACFNAFLATISLL